MIKKLQYLTLYIALAIPGLAFSDTIDTWLHSAQWSRSALCLVEVCGLDGSGKTKPSGLLKDLIPIPSANSELIVHLEFIDHEYVNLFFAPRDQQQVASFSFPYSKLPQNVKDHVDAQRQRVYTRTWICSLRNSTLEFKQRSDLSAAKVYTVSSAIPSALEISLPAIRSIQPMASMTAFSPMTTLADNEPTYVWTRMLGSSNNDNCYSIAANGGAIYVYGKYASADLFLRKYSSVGTVEWSSQWTSAGSNYNSPNGADTAADGSIYVTGGARGAIDGQPYSSSSDLFLSKYSSSGTRLWTRMASSQVNNSPDYAKAVATTASGDVYVAGTHGYPQYENGTIYYDSDFCLYKYDSSGNLLGRTWPWGSAGYDQVYGAASGADNSVYMAGIIYGDGFSSGCAAYQGNGDLYVSKHDSSGVFLWDQLLGSTNGELFYSGMGNGIEVAPDGSVYVTCCTVSTGINQAYLAKLSPTDGSVLWSRTWGAGSAATLASGIDIDASGNVYVCGTTYGSFDGQTYSGSQGQIFISKFDADGNRLWSRFKGSADGDFGTDIAIDGGNIYAGGSVSGSVDGQSYSGNNDMVLIRWTNAVASADVEVLSISTTTNSAVIEAGTNLEKSDFLITTLPENRQDAVSIFPTSFQNAGVYTVEAYTLSSTASCEVVVVDLNDPLNLTSLQDLMLLPVVDGSPTMSSRISPELFSRLVDLAKAYNIPMDFNYSPLWNDWEMAQEVAQTAWAQGQILARQGYGTADRDACVADPVNLVSGVFYETEADLVLPAPIPLIIGRNYASGGTALSELGYGWALNHHCYLTANRPVGMLAAGQNLPDTAEIRFVTDCGTALVFSRNSSMDANRLKVGGAASASEDNPSLNNDNQLSGAAGLLKNIDLVYTPSTRTFRLLTADGEVRDYGWKEYGTPNTLDYRKRLCLEQRVYPDGNKIKYAYTNALLSRIEAVNSNETIVFNGVDFAYTNALVSSITADDGRSVQYVYDAYGDLKSVVRVDNSEVIYGYEHISTNGIPAEYSSHRIARVEHPGSRILLNDYYMAGEIVGGSALPFDDYRVGRVKAQYRTTSTPTPELNSTFSYNMDAQTLAGSVTVYDALQNKAVYQVDTNGLITAIETYVKNRDANGQPIMSNGDFTYRLYSVVRKFWDDSKLIYRTVEDHSGDVWLHWGAGYDDRGNMLTETISGNLTGEFTSPLVITTSGALLSGESATRTYTYTYDPVSNPMDRLNLITSITTSKGAVKRNIWDEGSGRLMASLTCRADADGNPENNPVYARTCYTYNTNGVLTTTVSDDGTSADPQNLSGVTTRRITHIVPGEIAPLHSLPATVIEVFDEGGGVQTNSSLVYSYNTHGFSERTDVYAADQNHLYFTSNRVDAVGRVLAARDSTGSIVTYEYDQNGNVLELNGPLPGDADRTAFGYDYANRLVATTNYNGNLQIRTYRNYDAADNLEWSTDARGFTTDYVYDDLYRRTQVLYPANPSGTRPVETFEYDLFGNVDQYFDAESNVWNYASTPAGNLFGVWHPNGLTHDVFTFDLQGGMTNSLIDASQLALNQTMEFDEFNRLLLVHKDRDTLEYDYDAFGQQTNRIAGGRSWETKFDALGRIEKQFRPSRSVEEYQYNELGYRTHFWNAESKPTTFGVDAKGRTTSITNALGRATCYSYDEAGNVEWRIKPDQEQTVNQYDALNQLTNVLHEGVWKSSFSYDPNGNNVAQGSPRASCTFGVDEMNRLKTSTQSVDAVSFIVDNSYNLNGSRTGIAYPEGLVVDYEYDEENRVKFITASGGCLSVPFTVEHGYDGASRLRSITYPNGINSSFGYDAESRVTNIVHGSFINRAIQRNALGFKETELINAGLKPTVPATARSIKTHNDADQLVSESIRTDLTDWTSVIYSYSANGCLTSSVSSASSVVYQYDYDNRLVNVDDASSFVSYLYDASGSRIGRIHNSVTNYFVVDYSDALKRPLAETDALGNVLRYYVWSGSQLLCHIDASGAVRYYHADELGSTLALTDASGNVTDQFAYMPYGYANHSGSTSTPFQWLGGYGVYYDADTDLHLTLHRAYSSTMKRFIHPDPLGIDGGVNVYMWANMNPLAFVDPYGLCAGSIWESGSYLGDVGLVFQGYNDAIGSAVLGVWQLVRHPIQSGQGIVYAGTHPGQTWTALKSDYSGRWNSGLRGQGSIFGEGLLTIATLGAGFADDAGTVGRIGNMTRKLDAALPDEVVPKSGVSWNNGWRTADGKFASPAGAGRSGAAAEQSVWNAVKQKPGWNVIEGNVGVRNASGQLRYYDGAAVSPRGRIIGLEVKSGSAVRTGAQSVFDAGVNTYNPAMGVGNNLGTEVGRSLLIQVP